MQSGSTQSKFDDTMKGAKLLAKWLYAVHKGLVGGTRIATEQDNVELLAFAKE